MIGARRSKPKIGVGTSIGTVFRVEPMTQGDVNEVSRVERLCFTDAWPTAAYRRELRNTLQNTYLVLRSYPDPETGQFDAFDIDEDEPPRFPRRLPRLQLSRRSDISLPSPRIVGFAGMWTIFDESHVTTIGVDPSHRGRGFGEVLLLALADAAILRGANWLTLEVRVTNVVAQRLYHKYGFAIQGTRKHYYSDNGEDAHIMWSRSLQDTDYLLHLQTLRASLQDHFGATVAIPRSAPIWATVNKSAPSNTDRSDASPPLSDTR